MSAMLISCIDEMTMLCTLYHTIIIQPTGFLITVKAYSVFEQQSQFMHGWSNHSHQINEWLGTTNCTVADDCTAQGCAIKKMVAC